MIMALSPDLSDFYDRWHAKAAEYSTEELRGAFDRFFTLYVIFNTPFDGQNPDTRSRLVNGHQRTLFEHRLMTPKGRNQDTLQVPRCDVLGAYLDDAWAFSVGGCQQGTKAQIVSEYDIPRCICPRHDLGIGGARVADRRPMDGSNRGPAEPLPSLGRGSYRQPASRDLKRNLYLFRTPRGVRQRLANVPSLKVGVEAQDLSFGVAGRNQADNRADGDAQSADAGFAAHNGGVGRDAAKSDHAC